MDAVTSVWKRQKSQEEHHFPKVTIVVALGFILALALTKDNCHYHLY